MHQHKLNTKDKRIIALADRNLDKSVDWIARKVGYGNPPSDAGIARVREALAKR